MRLSVCGGRLSRHRNLRQYQTERHRCHGSIRRRAEHGIRKSGCGSSAAAVASPTPVKQGDLLPFTFPVWNRGPNVAYLEELKTQVPAGTTFDYIRISGTKRLGTCTTPPYGGTGPITCYEHSAMAPNTTWTLRDGEGDGPIRQRDHRNRNRDGRYTGSEPGGRHSDCEHNRAVRRLQKENRNLVGQR